MELTIVIYGSSFADEIDGLGDESKNRKSVYFRVHLNTKKSHSAYNMK